MGVIILFPTITQLFFIKEVILSTTHQMKIRYYFSSEQTLDYIISNLKLIVLCPIKLLLSGKS